MTALLLLLVNWVALLPSVTPSVPRLEIQKNGSAGVCSGVVFEIDKDGFAHALTAAHCVERSSDTERIDLTVNGRNGVTVATNALLDLAIVKFRARNETVVTLAKTTPPTGTEVAIVGYGFGIEELSVQFGRVAIPYQRDTKAIWIDGMALFGDSGGSVISETGDLIGITSRIYSAGMMGQMAHISAAVPIEHVNDFIDDYRAKRK
jgi:S1-C subfamily serine protease